MDLEAIFNRVMDKLDTIDTRINSIDKTMVKHEENLSEHMRRTELAEKAIETLATNTATNNNTLATSIKAVSDKLSPIITFYENSKFLVKTITFIFLTIGGVWTIMQIIHNFHGYFG